MTIYYIKKEFKALHKCPRCRVSGYKAKDDNNDEDDMKKNPPVKVLWYFYIISRFKLFLPMLMM